MSGPLMDRIDIHVEVPRVEYDKLTDERLGEPSASVRARIERAREPQKARFAGRTGGPSGNVPLVCNADTLVPASQMQVWARPRCETRSPRDRASSHAGAGHERLPSYRFDPPKAGSSLGSG